MGSPWQISPSLLQKDWRRTHQQIGRIQLEALAIKAKSDSSISFAKGKEEISEQASKKGGRLGPPTKKHPQVHLTGHDMIKEPTEEGFLSQDKVNLLQEFNLTPKSEPQKFPFEQIKKTHGKDPFEQT